MRRRVLLVLCVVSVLALSHCASKSKKTTPELSRYEGKKIALVEVDGESQSALQMEVSLVNQLRKHGSFFLVSKKEVQDARAAIESDQLDPVSLAKAAGADVALRAKVLEFEALERQGYREEDIEDSLYEKETGKKTRKNLYKVKSLDGSVKFELVFTEVESREERRAIAAASDRMEAEGKTAAVRIAPKLAFLEMLSNRAFEEFFKEHR